MGININGYDLTNQAGLKFGASNTKIVAADYGVLDPALPGMNGSVTSGSPYKSYPFPVNSLWVNNGSPWSVSTFRFTAPVAGVYYVSYGGIVGDGTQAQVNAYYAIIVNGVNTYFSYHDTLSTWELFHIEGMFKLEAGDTVAFAMNTAPGPTTTSTGGAYTTNHNICCIWLVG